MNNSSLAERFGQTLGIGKPNQNVSQSTVHKYRKVFDICQKGESKEMINDIINENLQFTIAAEILAPIKDPEDRNSFYMQIIKALAPTRPQAIEIKKILETLSPHLRNALARDEIQVAIQKALLAEHKSDTFLKLLQKQPKGNIRSQSEFQNKVTEIRKTIFGTDISKNDFKIDQQGKGNELTIQVKIRPDNIFEILTKLKGLSDLHESLTQLFNIRKS
jgi:hypothetical protein